MKSRSLVFSLILALLLTGGAMTLLGAGGNDPLPALAQASIRYVSSGSGQDAGDCANPTAPCRSIQYAVDQAVSGDEVHVAAYELSGLPPTTTTLRYTGSGENVIALTRDLHLRGGYVYVPTPGIWTPGFVPAEVDGEGSRRVIHISGVTTTLELLSFVNGHATRGGNVYAEDANVTFRATPVLSGVATYGGGLYLKDCRTTFDIGALNWIDISNLSLLPVQRNHAEYGGGLYVDGGTPFLSGLYVRANTAAHDGGGVYLTGGRATLAGGWVLENEANDRGGGFFLRDSPARVVGTTVYSNVAANGAGFYLDGPFAFSEETVPIIANSYVRHNRTTGSQGGGFYFREAIAGLVNNVIADNHATEGAALYLWAASPQLFHNTIAQNIGQNGIYLTHKPGQIWPPVVPIPSLPAITNTILVSHTVGVVVDSTGLPAPLQNEASFYGTLWHGNGSDTGGAGKVNRYADVVGDPRFTCTGAPPDCLNPYHILTGSAALDAGVPVALTLPGSDLLVDIDLQLRPSGAGYDIGADEVVSETYSVWLVPPLSTQTVRPGRRVTHTHWLLNTGLQTDTFTLTHQSNSGWATLVTPSSIEVGAQHSATVHVAIAAPPTASLGMSDTTRITATSMQARANALDVTAVVTNTGVDLAVTKQADVTSVRPGEAVRYTLTVSRTGALTGTLKLTDRVIPTATLAAWTLPADCDGVTTTGQITCAWALPSYTPFTHTFPIVITTSTPYTGLLINTVSVGMDGVAQEDNYANNAAQVVVAVSASAPSTSIYLPLVMRMK